MNELKQWFDSGVPYIWLNAGAVSVCMVMVAGLIILIAGQGLGHFWPAPVASFQYQQRDQTIIDLMGEIVDQETVSASRANTVSTDPSDQGPVKRSLIKTGNRDILGADFRWIEDRGTRNMTYPATAMVLERREWGNFYGLLLALKQDGRLINDGDNWSGLLEIIARNNRIFNDIHHIEKDLIGAINYQMEQLRLSGRRLELKGVEQGAPAWAEISRQQKKLEAEYKDHIAQLSGLYSKLDKHSLIARIADGTEVEMRVSKIVRAYRPNNMTLLDKGRFYLEKLWEFVSDDPREANTEGGIFPAIFGTVLMVIIMAIIVTPFGMIAAVYLHEYAKQGPLTQLIRIAVNNLAGVPSIVYGVFGLGFFVYFVGGSIDELLFPEALPRPTFGTPGLLWASLTLAILTLPVVIVSTEEGLSRVPRAIREGSLALGATKAETLWRTVLPMTAPAMMTGLILAVARATGEVAPLMLVGVVKLAPSLPLDGHAPFLHLDRKFMHLGFHIYDVGFQSPNVEAARPLVYATALLLVLIIITLNLTAIKIRNDLREKYRAAEQH